MTELVKLAAARALVDAGAVHQALVVGISGGWAVHLQTPNAIQVLSSERAQVRRFGSFESALKILRELGVSLDALRVDAAQWEPEGLSGPKRRPDRAAAMKLKNADARYTAMLRTSLEEARADPRPALSSAEAKQHMDSLKRKMSTSLDAALGTR